MNLSKPLKQILKQNKEFYPIIIVYSVVIIALSLATPIAVQSLVNTFSFGPLLQPIFVLGLLLLSLLSLLGLIKSLQYLVVEYLQRKVFAKTTATIIHALTLENGKNESWLTGRTNRYFDVITIQKSLAFLISDGLAVLLQVFFGLLLLVFYHPLFIPFGILIFLSLTVPFYLFVRSGTRTADEESSSKYAVANYLDRTALPKKEPIENLAVIEEGNSRIANYLSFRGSHFRIQFTQNIIYMALFALLNALLFGLGGYLVISHRLTVGQLVAAEIVVNAILSNFLYSKKYLDAYYDLSASANKMGIFFDVVEKNNKNNEEFYSQFSAIRGIKTPRNYKRIFKQFLFWFSVSVILLLVIPWQQTSRGTGKVIALNPNDRPQLITAPVSGIIESWLIKDGQTVEVGVPLVKIVDNDPNYLARLESQRDTAVRKFEAAREASDTGRLNYRRQEALVKDGLSSLKDFEAAKIVYKKLLAEEAAASESLTKAEVDLSRQEMQVVTAPRSGKILRILHGSGTTNVKQGDGLLQFVPETSENSVEIFIDGNDMPLVFEGRKVRLQFEGWPSIQFSGWPSVAIGSFGGIVRVVDPSVSPDGTFRVLVVPDPEESIAWPDSRTLRQGARTVGLVILDRVSLGYELWRKLNGFPKSMRTSPYTTENNK